MSMRRVLNVAWTLACEGLDANGVKDLRSWVYADPENEKAQQEEERKRRARENQSAVTDLAGLFSMGG
jgi:hypothetical protein